MTDEALKDLSRLRQIAEEGRRLPLLGGRHMILWGTAVMVALLLHWAVATRLLAWPMISLAFIWFGLTGLAAVVGRLPLMGTKKVAQAGDIGNRIEQTVWQYGGSVLGLVSVSIFLLSMFKQSQTGSTTFFLLFTLMPPISFAVYAIALRTTAEAAELPALKSYGLIALLFVPVTILLAGTSWQMLAAALGIFIVAILPGRMLIALEKGANNG
jgi:hypothetical protein